MRNNTQLYEVLTNLMAGEQYFHGFTDDPNYELHGAKAIVLPISDAEVEYIRRYNPQYSGLLKKQ